MAHLDREHVEQSLPVKKVVAIELPAERSICSMVMPCSRANWTMPLPAVNLYQAQHREIVPSDRFHEVEGSCSSSFVSLGKPHHHDEIEHHLAGILAGDVVDICAETIEVKLLLDRRLEPGEAVSSASAK